MNKYSVLMSVYKKENPKFLEQALKSMINQSVLPDEIVLVEDGPLTQSLYHVINIFKTNYPDLMKIVISDKNIGLGKALNLGLENCRNELVARMDTDDISKPKRCEKQLVKFSENLNLVLLGTFVDEFDSNTNKLIAIREVPTNYKNIYQFNKRRSAFNHPTVMFKKTPILSAGGYKDLKRNQDIELFGRLLYSGVYAENIGESLLYFRTSLDSNKRKKNWENTWSYINTIKEFNEMGYSSKIDVILVTLGQSLIFILPNKIQSIIYGKFLRKNINDKYRTKSKLSIK